MYETKIKFTERLENLMLGSFEPMTEEQALDQAEWDGVLNELTVNDVSAALARAKFRVLGELIANEHETPDSVRILGENREQAIEYFTKLFTR